MRKRKELDALVSGVGVKRVGGGSKRPGSGGVSPQDQLLSESTGDEDYWSTAKISPKSKRHYGGAGGKRGGSTCSALLRLFSRKSRRTRRNTKVSLTISTATKQSDTYFFSDRIDRPTLIQFYLIRRFTLSKSVHFNKFHLGEIDGVHYNNQGQKYSQPIPSTPTGLSIQHIIGNRIRSPINHSKQDGHAEGSERFLRGTNNVCPVENVIDRSPKENKGCFNYGVYPVSTPKTSLPESGLDRLPEFRSWNEHDGLRGAVTGVRPVPPAIRDEKLKLGPFVGVLMIIPSLGGGENGGGTGKVVGRSGLTMDGFGKLSSLTMIGLTSSGDGGPWLDMH
ncbi:unnamed protein product [Nesidiocoris tenuis]|uniref:Uncharacterized protein n=1 Tax=Nesidiocoris tenuis TaxID=355587 RepID=A0A6H5HYW4_9HEMI|nr:unnamed protein product [Nesidiocoris tenuis]